MKRSWRVHRRVQLHPDALQRWDRAYQQVLRLARPIEPASRPETALDRRAKGEVRDEGRDLCACLDSAAGSDAVH